MDRTGVHQQLEHTALAPDRTHRDFQDGSLALRCEAITSPRQLQLLYYELCALLRPWLQRLHLCFAPNDVVAGWSTCLESDHDFGLWAILGEAGKLVGVSSAHVEPVRLAGLFDGGPEVSWDCLAILPQAPYREVSDLALQELRIWAAKRSAKVVVIVDQLLRSAATPEQGEDVVRWVKRLYYRQGFRPDRVVLKDSGG